MMGILAAFLAPAVWAGEPAGHWEGSIEVPGTPLGVSVDLTESDGVWSGTIDIPLQGARGLALAGVVVDGSAVQFAIAAVPGDPTFKGTLEGGMIRGTFMQGGQSFPFKLVRGEAVAAQPEPESPDETGEPIQLETETGVLGGILRLPTGDGPHPIALIVAGSGPTDRDGNNPLIPGRNDSLKMIAEALAETGVASVRYDKRGLGTSAGAGKPESELRFEDFVDDAVAWIRTLQADERFGRVGVVGHSEGSLIGMLATRKAETDAFVSIAGPGRPAADILIKQFASQPEEFRTEAGHIIGELLEGRQVSDVTPLLAQAFRESVQPYLISWFRYDPAKEIAKLSVPVLIVQGTTDIQIGVEEGQLLHEARPDATYAVIEGMNHVLKQAPAERAANAAAYSDPSLPLVPEFADALTEFLSTTLTGAP
jgi:pimeloyl-ACP methyl ester carboxylesterase